MRHQGKKFHRYKLNAESTWLKPRAYEMMSILGSDDGDVVPGTLFPVQRTQGEHGAVVRVDIKHPVHVRVPVYGVPGSI